MAPQAPAVNPFAEELKAIQKSWFWLLILGIALIVVGFLAMGSSLLTTLIFEIVFGILFLVGSCAELASSIFARKWSGFILHVLAGVLYFVVGLLVLSNPGITAVAITLMLAAVLLVEGMLRIISALMHRFAHWGWALAHGVVAFILGVLIWRHWPEDSLWVIGMFIGIDMLFSGWSWVMLALSLRSMIPPQPAQETLPGQSPFQQPAAAPPLQPPPVQPS
jgi:uncharacterized membrane protein HdeD (DUF308 family)